MGLPSEPVELLFGPQDPPKNLEEIPLTVLRAVRWTLGGWSQALPYSSVIQSINASSTHYMVGSVLTLGLAGKRCKSEQGRFLPP